MTDNETDCLRPLAEPDLALVRSWRNHESVRRYMYTQHEIGEKEHRDWFARCELDPLRHLLVYDVDDQPRGFVHFTVQGAGRVADWGFYIAPEAPRGTGTGLGRRALEFAFQRLQLHKICGQALGFNQRSIDFHRKMGFCQEGVLRDQHFDGQQFHGQQAGEGNHQAHHHGQFGSLDKDATDHGAVPPLLSVAAGAFVLSVSSF